MKSSEVNQNTDCFRLSKQNDRGILLKHHTGFPKIHSSSVSPKEVEERGVKAIMKCKQRVVISS